VQGESLIMFWARFDVLWLIIAGEVVAVALLVRMGVRLFNREELLGREIDELNLRRVWHEFRRGFTGHSGGSLARWYRQEVPRTVRVLWQPLALMALALAAGLWVGLAYADKFPLPPDFVQLQGMSSQFSGQLQKFGLFTPRGAFLILFLNLRALLLAALLGIFSVGVLSVVILMAPLGLAGYFAGQVALAGANPALFLAAFILPHGIFEIPAALLAGAAILRLGATLVSPPPGKSVGEAWIAAFADLARIMVGVVVPLLLLGALMEVFVTPRVVLAVYGG